MYIYSILIQIIKVCWENNLEQEKKNKQSE